MKELEKLFDKYSFTARVKPALFLVLPVVISIFVLYEPSRSWGGAIITFITSFGIITFVANQMSTRGNILQEKLFKKWGGAPTTLILRHSDPRLDKHTKARYMLKLEQIVPNFKVVTKSQELDDPESADEMYRTAATFLREHTRNTSQHPLVFSENISYGFSRNTRAFKWLGVLISLLAIIFSSIIVWFKYIRGNDAPFFDLIFNIPFETISLLVLLFLILLVWLFAITEKWVEMRAFAYARALFASCDYNH
ncbi:hypothetical protein ACT7TX_001598 [Vibrio cholerae]|nr:hypothetical protein [Vibrio cholerae]ELL1565231.1 hypothetical protein [Vibrio cholerae]